MLVIKYTPSENGITPYGEQDGALLDAGDVAQVLPVETGGTLVYLKSTGEYFFSTTSVDTFNERIQAARQDKLHRLRETFTARHKEFDKQKAQAEDQKNISVINKLASRMAEIDVILMALE